ncbi:MAG: PepSY-associated TM helix domain-containing protein [Pseudomonadota bacterium]
MQRSFKDAMDWLHTWAGIILGAVMFVIFFMGTLSVFADETDQWFWPSVRHVETQQPVSLDRLLDTALEVSGRHPEVIGLVKPTERMPAAQILVQPKEGRTWIYFVDPETYEILAPLDSGSASQFFYPMHYRLHIPGGRWIVGATSMFLLLGLFSGIIIHKKIFVDFFTFRKGKKLPRVSLDLHNLTSVLAMPFHLAITITGILIFASLYLERSAEALYPEDDSPRSAVRADTYGGYSRELSGETNLRISSVDAMATRAAQHMNGQPIRGAYLRNPHDEDGIAYISSVSKDYVSVGTNTVTFDPDSGAVLNTPSMSAAGKAQDFIVGMHEIHFDHLLLRWLYVIGGLAGCVMIATGFIYWIESRRVKHARGEKNGVPVVEGLTIWAVMGLLTATAAYFVANQALPRGTWQFWGIERVFWEVIVFYVVWLLAIPHGAFRKRNAWFDQSVLLAVLCCAAVLLNWGVTGDNLLRTIWIGQWSVAIMDMVLLLTAVTAGYAALRLKVNWRTEVEYRNERAAKQALRAAANTPTKPPALAGE